MAFSAKVQDEIGHGQLLYRAAESLGIKTREEMLDDLAEGRGSSSTASTTRWSRGSRRR